MDVFLKKSHHVTSYFNISSHSPILLTYIDMRFFDGNLLQSFQLCNAWMQCAELKVMKKDVVFQRSLVNHQMGHPQNSYVSLLQGILKYGNNMKKKCWCGTKWTNARIQVVYIPVICSFRFCVVYCLASQRKNKWTPGKYPKDHVESIPSWKHWSGVIVTQCTTIWRCFPRSGNRGIKPTETEHHREQRKGP